MVCVISMWYSRSGEAGNCSPQGNSGLVVVKKKGSKREYTKLRLKGRRSGAPEAKGEQASSLWHKGNFI